MASETGRVKDTEQTRPVLQNLLRIPTQGYSGFGVYAWHHIRHIRYPHRICVAIQTMSDGSSAMHEPVWVPAVLTAVTGCLGVSACSYAVETPS